MKQVKCSDLGGACDTVVTGETPEAMIDSGWKHLQEAHPERAKEIMSNTKEVNDKWMAEFKEKFPSLQDA